MPLEDSALLVDDATQLLRVIEKHYQDSLEAQTIPPVLRVRIKQFLDNCRSALDFAAFEIFNKVCAPSIPASELPRAQHKVYFPQGANQADFMGKINNWFPGLASARPDIVTILEACQAYATLSPWLKRLGDLVNENKHHQLSPQSRTVVNEVRATGPGGTISWNPAQVKFGPGVRINGVPIDPRTQTPRPSPTQRVEVITWVGFNFSTLNLDVVATLREILGETRAIITALQPLL